MYAGRNAFGQGRGEPRPGRGRARWWGV